MVHYTTHQRVKRHGYPTDDWKLEGLRSESDADVKAIIRELKYYFLTSSNKNRLLDLLSRQARGLLSYDGCRADGLTKFCVRRGLPASTKSKTSKAVNITPEIRVIVYTEYFHSLPDLVHPTQPPLAKASRIVPSESVPVFYKTCNFVMVGAVYSSGRYISFRACKRSFFSAIPEDHLSMIRHLSIETTSAGEQVRWSNGKAWIAAPDGKEEENPVPLARSLHRFLKGIDSVPPCRGLTRADVKQIQKMIAGGAFQLNSA